MDINAALAAELSVPAFKVQAAVNLLDEGATVPFIARYRKEATGGLDDAQLRALESRLGQLRNLESERARVLASIDEQGKLTPELRKLIEAADTLTRLEDLYLPYRPKRRTKAQMALEAGLEPLADRLLGDPRRKPEVEAMAFISEERGVADVKAALDGAREILMQRAAEDADINGAVREHLRKNGRVTATVIEGKNDPASRFRDYFQHDEAFGAMPGHRALALFRGQSEEVLSLRLVDPGPPEVQGPSFAERLIAARWRWSPQSRPADAWIAETLRLAWKGKLVVRAELALFKELRERAEAEAIRVFSKNLREVLLAAPAGGRTILGLDPGIRTGVKVAVVARTGRVLETTTVYPHPPKNDWKGAVNVLSELVRRHDVELVAIGNGTASRETDRLAADVLALHPDRKVLKVLVSEAGASVYSASELASAELPDMDVSLRGAVSIARRLQDPLAELVKIDPRSIGVGQYQHDVSQPDLATALDAVVEDCVNAVGVELNTASPALLERVAGLSPSVARAIVGWRDQNGAFKSRKQLLEVPRLGPKTFEQCAGFLRIRGGADPLDASAVHPESYPLVERILRSLNKPLIAVLGDAATLRGLNPARFTDERFGVPTVTDILVELEKPGRDPRPEFHVARFKEGVETLGDLAPGMVLEGVVTNVAAFGAFVDIGVHQDGLVHISQLSDRFVQDPHTVVKPGQVETVRVVEVDLPRKRIALTMKSGEVRPPAPRADAPRPPAGPRPPAPPERKPAAPPERKQQAPFNSAFANLTLKG